MKNIFRRLWGFLRFLPLFIYAFIKANVEVAAIILFVSKSKLTPSIFSFDVSGMSKLEILILSHVISLTPGTVTIDICPDKSSILIHSLHYKDPEETEREITEHLKKSILRFTR